MQETIQVVVDKEAYAVAEALVKFAGAVKQAMSDGFQPGADIPAVIGAAIGNFADKVADFQALPEMAKSNPAEFVKAFVIAGGDMYEVLKA